MWPLFYDKIENKWVVGEFSRACDEDSYYFRSEAEEAVELKNSNSFRTGTSGVPFWQESEE